MARPKRDPVAHALNAYKELTEAQRATFSYVVSMLEGPPATKVEPKRKKAAVTLADLTADRAVS